MKRFARRLGFALLCVANLVASDFTLAQSDWLPSWNEGPAKQAIIKFVQTTTDPKNAQFVPPGAAHRNLRPGRDAVGRASNLYTGPLLLGPRAGGGETEAGIGRDRALQDRVVW
jgi:hypothetical protein